MEPFDYPASEHVRRHGPGGYESYRSYRPWLRDEFTFRCVYCLKREQWGIARGTYDIDHFRPQVTHSEAGLDYGNLFYACASCNSAKGDQAVPDPCRALTAESVRVDDDGSIEGLTDDAKRTIRRLGLDGPEYREFRMMMIGISRLARSFDPELYARMMRFPDDLPDLSRLRPPSNSRPEGVQQSCFARRQRGELPPTY
jgi:hypothetical protein